VTDVRVELDRELEEQFAALRTHDDWPDPWPDREVPSEAYSRVTDPDRWLLGPERGEAWARALVAVGLAVRTDEPGSILLTPVTGGALPLRMVPHVPPPGEVNRSAALEVRAGDPGVTALEPDCHCDACDSGSADLLREIDEAVWHVLEGDFVHIDLGHGHRVTTHRGGWSSNGPPRRWRRWATPDELIADVRAGRSRYPVVSGSAWW
jgi:hypothetical protein